MYRLNIIIITFSYTNIDLNNDSKGRTSIGFSILINSSKN